MGGGGSQTTTQKSTPWEGQQPYLRDLFRQAQGQFNQGPLQYYPGQTVAPFSPQTMMGMDLMTQRALGGSPQQDAFGQYLQNAFGQQNIDPAAAAMQGGGMVGSAANAMQGMTGYGGLGEAQSFAGSPAMGALPSSQHYAQNQMGVGGAGNRQLGQTAGGAFLGSNPYLDQMFDRAAGRAGEAFNENVIPGINATFGAGGRTGGGIHQEMMGNAQRQFGRDLQDMAADIYLPAYESERDRMVQAAGTGSQAGLGAAQLGGDLFSRFNQNELGRNTLGANLYLGDRGLGQQGASMLGNLGNSYIDSMGGMYGNIGQNQFRAGSLVPSFNDMQYGDIQRLMGVGGMIEDQTQRLMGGNQDRWNFGQQAPWQNINNYANAIYGLPGGYGTQTSTQPGGSRLQGALGGAMAGSQFGPWGALGGGILGGLL